MAYTPTTWKTGDTITAEKLNHAEQGIKANDTAISAIPTGLSLYGPYTGTLGESVSISAGTSETLVFENFANADSETVEFPIDNEDVKSILTGYDIGYALDVTKIESPAYDDFGACYFGRIRVENNGESPVTVGVSDANITFFTDTELAVVS